jgi:DNA polymerase III sliding clamp (beta) subunit (PCNA family)
LKTLRFIKEKLAANDGFELTIEEEEEEEEEEEIEIEVPENQLLYLFQLLVDSDNKYNRDEIKQYRAALQEDLY